MREIAYGIIQSGHHRTDWREGTPLSDSLREIARKQSHLRLHVEAPVARQAERGCQSTLHTGIEFPLRIVGISSRDTQIQIKPEQLVRAVSAESRGYVPHIIQSADSDVAS